jgi:hypothetical protein
MGNGEWGMGSGEKMLFLFPTQALIAISATRNHQTEKCWTEKCSLLFFCPAFFCLVAETMIKARNLFPTPHSPLPSLSLLSVLNFLTQSIYKIFAGVEAGLSEGDLAFTIEDDRGRD